MEGAGVIIKRHTTRLLKVTLADGRQVMFTYMCDIHINGLPFVLTGHIIPDLSIALLFGIQVLMEVGCNIFFDKHECTVRYKGKIILSGDKDLSTDLWTLPLGSVDMTTHRVNAAIPLAAPLHANAHAHLPPPIACFTHTVRTKANRVHFTHQSLCSPHISTLLKAIRRGVTSNSSAHCTANKIDNDNSPCKANLFFFAAFADKHTRTLYNNLTGLFPFQSFEGNICFLVVYHYKTNAILALPTSCFSNEIIFAVYKQQYEMLESKGCMIRLNVMDNQASQTIKKFLTKNQCKLMLVEPHIHRVNAAERAIQIFKDHFVSALATTDSKFPLQLWDRLAPQVKNTLNMLCPLRIIPNMPAYEAVYGPYDWNHFLLAPPGC
jgi:hypothetical protein